MLRRAGRSSQAWPQDHTGELGCVFTYQVQQSIHTESRSQPLTSSLAIPLSQLLFELAEDGDAPWSKGSETWLSAYESSQSKAEHEVLASFRIIDSDNFKLNSEPAPPGTMLESGLLEKLVGTTQKLLAGALGRGARSGEVGRGAHSGKETREH